MVGVQGVKESMVDREQTARDSEPETQPVEPGPPAPDGDGSDVEGHGLLAEHLGRQMAGDRAREAAEWQRGEAARREQKRSTQKPKR